MPRTKKATVRLGGSFTTALFVLFLVLKMTGTITWSWWWVTAPLWVPVAIALALYLIMACLMISGFLAFAAWVNWGK